MQEIFLIIFDVYDFSGKNKKTHIFK